MQRDTVRKRAVRNILERCLVYVFNLLGYAVEIYNLTFFLWGHLMCLLGSAKCSFTLRHSSVNTTLNFLRSHPLKATLLLRSKCFVMFSQVCVTNSVHRVCVYSSIPLGKHPPTTTGYSQQVGGTHPTGMHSCLL